MPQKSNLQKHNEYIDIKESDTAVLFIHGIIGTPRQFDFLINEMPQNISVYNMLLSGHGKGVKNFSAASMKSWESEVHKALEFLRKKHRRIFICGHSMGTLLAIDEILKDKKGIEGLFLLQIPLYVHLSLKMIKDIFTILFGNVKEKSSAYYTENSYGIEKDKRLWLYVPWLLRYIELFIKKRKVRKRIKETNIPALAFQSEKDELVKIKSYRFLIKNSPFKTFLLNNSGHFYYGSDSTFIKDKFLDFIKEKARS